MININFAGLNAGEAKNLVSDEINSFVFDARSVARQVNTPVGKETASEIEKKAIGVMSYQYRNNLYDGRNEYSVKLADRITKKLSLEPFDPACIHCMTHVREVDTPTYLAAKMAYAHRTLQQTWASLMFQFLIRFDKESCAMLDGETLELMNYVPFI